MASVSRRIKRNKVKKYVGSNMIRSAWSNLMNFKKNNKREGK